MTDVVLVWVSCGALGLLLACHRQPKALNVLLAPLLVPKVWTELVGRALIGGPIVLLLEVAILLKIDGFGRGTVIGVFLGMLVGLTGGYTACG